MAVNDLKTLWQTVLSDIQLDLSETVFRSILVPTQLLKKDVNILEIGCPNKFSKDRLEERYYGQIKKAVDRITGEKNELVFSIHSHLEPSVVPLPEGSLFTAPAISTIQPAQSIPTEKPMVSLAQRGYSGLSPHYGLSNFVVGTSNNLAFAVAQGIVNSPGKLHNPFFLYADVGLGKTHLSQAIGNEILKRNSQAKVIYCTSEDFTNELIQAVQNRKTALFKNKFRTTDLLIVDDVQFIAGKDSIQEEFFHTFNALYQQQKQIVLTCDRPPKEIQRLEERLSSRFGCGMIADIQSPDYSTRVAILRDKRDQFHFEIADSLLDLIAEYVTANIRELEGALKQVVTVALTKQTSPTPELIAETLSKNHQPIRKTVGFEKIIEAITVYYGISKEEILGKSRRAEYVIARQMAMYAIRNLTETPLIKLGQQLGGRDHTTVMHGLKKVEATFRTSPKLKQDFINIKQSLGVA
ncbi:MAG: chromosomal replication initiator protein DnaA [Patescibacteria group bacterium]